MAELLKVVYSEKFGLRNGSLEKKWLSATILMKQIQSLKSPCLAVTLLKIQLLSDFGSDLDPPRALTLQVNKAASIKTWFSKALHWSAGEWRW